MTIPYLVQKRIDEGLSFDIYLAGGSYKDLNIDLYKGSYCRLYSQLNDRKNIVDHVNFIKEHGRTGSKLFVDSGAHSAHTKGREVNVDDYINFVNNYDEYIDIFAQVDKIPGVYLQPKSIKDWKEAPELSWENYLYMREKSISPNKLIPVFHQGEDYVWLQNMLNETFNGDHIPYIGISPRGDVSVEDKIIFISECFSVIRTSKNPNVMVHSFGMTSLSVLEKYPFWSADATTWLRAAGFGQIFTPWGVQTISPVSLFKDIHIENMPKVAYKRLEEYVESMGFKLGGLKDNCKERTRFNACFLKKWADNYQYSGDAQASQIKLF